MRLYEIQSREVDSVTNLLKAVVEVNWHLAASREGGWRVTLSIDPDTRDVCVEVERSEPWPTQEIEREALLAGGDQ